MRGLLPFLAIAGTAIPARAQTPPPPNAVHVGVYVLARPDGTHDFTIAGAGDHLAGQPGVPLHCFGNHTFGADFDPGMRLIFAMDGARASKVTVHQGGGEYEGARK